MQTARGLTAADWEINYTALAERVVYLEARLVEEMAHRMFLHAYRRASLQSWHEVADQNYYRRQARDVLAGRLEDNAGTPCMDCGDVFMPVPGYSSVLRCEQCSRDHALEHLP